MMCYTTYELYPAQSSVVAVGLLFATVWVVSVSLSRLYMGVHCVTDLIGGWPLSIHTSDSC
jgi:membrane-associated phospholipid phosphatase